MEIHIPKSIRTALHGDELPPPVVVIDQALGDASGAILADMTLDLQRRTEKLEMYDRATTGWAKNTDRALLEMYKRITALEAGK